MIQFYATFLLRYQIFDTTKTKYQIFDTTKTKYQIFDRELESACLVLILTDDKRGKKDKKKMNIKMVATSQRQKEKTNKIILLFAIDNKTNLFYND